MIPRTCATVQPANWQNLLRQSRLSLRELLDALDLPLRPEYLANLPDQDFSLRVPPAFLAQMQRSNPDDPLLRQVLPLAQELYPASGFSMDPVGDRLAQKSPGLLHKYHGRVLLTLTGACAIHCRYCFRQHFPYADANPTHSAWQQTLDYLRADTSISEIILSGGDPLTLADTRLATITSDLATIPHLRRLRIHSRLPVVLPERITGELLHWLTATRLQPVLVIHANHANEIGPAATTALKQLRDHGVTLLNQSVLLAGVNDSVETLLQLSETLFQQQVLPYYLHMLDTVAGAAHFAVSDTRALQIMEQLRKQLPGYLLPRLVREQAGMPYKTPLL
ncbi:MAG: EF-P beta-lysylation protein EpmB [Gammaproteobacteria bacterium]